MSGNHGEVPPILNTPSAFATENLLREARRQKRITGTSIPAICILDPDGDMVRRAAMLDLNRHGGAITRSYFLSVAEG